MFFSVLGREDKKKALGAIRFAGVICGSERRSNLSYSKL